MLVYRLRVDVRPIRLCGDAFKTELGMPTCRNSRRSRRNRSGRGAPGSRPTPAARRSWPGSASGRIRSSGVSSPRRTRACSSVPPEEDLPHPGRRSSTPTYRRSCQPGQRTWFSLPRRYGLPLALLGFLVAIGLVWWAGGLRTNRRLVWFASVVFGTAVLSAVATIVAYTGEIQRFGIQETVATPNRNHHPSGVSIGHLAAAPDLPPVQQKNTRETELARPLD